MKKFLSTLLVSILAITSIFFAGCKESEITMDGYYTLSLTKSSVTVDGTTRNLSDYLSWKNMTLAEYEHSVLGTINIQLDGNNIVIFSDGVNLANGTFTMDGDSMLCSTEISTLLSYVFAQNLKWKNGEISFTMVYGEYTHNRVYVKNS